MDQPYLDHYREFGYAVVSGVFRPAEVRELAAAFDRVYRQGLGHRTSFRHGNVLFRVADDPGRGRVVRMVQWPSYFEPVLARYRTDGRLLALHVGAEDYLYTASFDVSGTKTAEQKQHDIRITGGVRVPFLGF